MARRYLPGGVNPFPVEPSPSIFRPTGPAEVFERLGEQALYFRRLPTPDHIQGLRTMPGAAGTGQGYQVTIQRSYKIADEVLPLVSRSGNVVQTQFGPIARVDRVRVFRSPAQGGSVDLPVAGYTGNQITVRNADGVEAWRQFRADYHVATTEPKTVEIVSLRDGRTLELDDHPELIRDASGRIANVAIAVSEVWLGNDDGTRTQLSGWTHDYTRVHLQTVYPAGTCFLVKLETYGTIPVAYRHVDVRRGDLRNLDIATGDLELVVDPAYLMAVGDLVVLTNSFETASERCTGDATTGLFNLGRVPVRTIEQVSAILPGGTQPAELDTTLFALEGFRKLRYLGSAGSKPRTITVTYTYHPQYRIEAQMSYSALAGRQQPRTFHAKPDPTALTVFA